MARNRSWICGRGAAWARRVALAGVLLLAAGRPARAQFFWYETQERKVTAQWTNHPTVTHSAPDFGPWNRSAGLGAALATQISTLGGTSLTVNAVTGGGYPP